MPAFAAIGFDADDTLWHNETLFEATHERYRALLARWHDSQTVDRTLFATEMRNLELYGYGVKSHALSAIETAITLTRGEIRSEEIRAIIEMTKAQLDHPVELLEGAADVVAALAPRFPLVLITKGDLRDQERKLQRSGLADHFSHVEIVSEKDPATYRRILTRHAIPPERFLMVGNSLKSDALPVLGLGGHAVHVPYAITWEAERAAAPTGEAAARFRVIASLRELPACVDQLLAA